MCRRIAPLRQVIAFVASSFEVGSHKPAAGSFSLGQGRFDGVGVVAFERIPQCGEGSDGFSDS